MLKIELDIGVTSCTIEYPVIGDAELIMNTNPIAKDNVERTEYKLYLI